MYDILIKNGRVHDGTGAPWFHADVAILDGRIAEIGQLDGKKARRIIDAEGKAVSPGFIDIHSHSDIVFIVDPKADSKVKQGVTLEVTGNCGSSVAPVTPKGEERASSGLEGYTMKPTWTSFAQYMDALDKAGPSINLACLVGHGQVRADVMGYDRRPPTAAEMNEMKALVDEAMAAGAIGMSSGLIYPPSSYADSAELVELSRVVAARRGLYFTHMRNESDGLLESVAESVTVGRKAGLPVQIAHHKVTGERNWGMVRRSIVAIEEARASGVDVTCDQYPYIASSTGLVSLIPGWAHEGGREALLARLTDPETRGRLAAEVNAINKNIWTRIMVSKVTTQGNKHFEGMDVQAIAAARGQEPVDATFDVLIEENADVGMIKFGMCEEDVKTVMQAPFVMIGSDGSSLCASGLLRKGKPHPRNYGTFVRVLGKYVREDGVLTLEEALRKMTSLPAWRLGLWDRGILRPGNWADVTVFDPATVKDNADFVSPHQYPTGVPYVVVNGRLVVDGGEHTGITPGKVLRRGR